MDEKATSTGFLGSLRGIVETLEQKSGLNSLLYLNAIIALPSLILYAFTDKSIFLVFAGILVVFTLVIYLLAFSVDRNFLRSEKHVFDLKQLDILGEKGKEVNERVLLDFDPITDPSPKKIEEGN